MATIVVRTIKVTKVWNSSNVPIRTLFIRKIGILPNNIRRITKQRQYCTSFPLIYLLYLLSMTFGIRDFVLACRLIQSSLASLRVRVPQAESLPPAFFRFHLTMDTLALS